MSIQEGVLTGLSGLFLGLSYDRMYVKSWEKNGAVTGLVIGFTAYTTCIVAKKVFESSFFSQGKRFLQRNFGKLSVSAVTWGAGALVTHALLRISKMVIKNSPFSSLATLGIAMTSILVMEKLKKTYKF